MPANTPRGYPYPLPTEPVAEGAQAIRNLAEALDAKAGDDLIQAITLSAPGTIDFTNIPQTYTHLRLVVAARTSHTTLTILGAQFNGITTATYQQQLLWQSGATVSGADGVNQARAALVTIPGADTGDANGWGFADVLVPNYRGGAGYARCISNGQMYGAPAHRNCQFSNICSSLTAAVTRILLLAEFGSLIAGSRASLYGVK